MAIVEIMAGQGKAPNERNPLIGLFKASVERSRVLRVNFPDLQPDFGFGNSAGLYGIAVAAGAMSDQTAINLIEERDKIVTATEERRGPTAMWALIGLTKERVLREIAEKCEIYISNDNGPLAQVVAGYRSALEEAKDMLKRAGVRKIIELNTRGAYHVPLRKPDSETYYEVLHKAEIGDPEYPLVTSTAPRVIYGGSELREEFALQMARPVNLPEVARVFFAVDIQKGVETSPGNTMQVLFSPIPPKLEIFTLENLSSQRRN